MDLFRILSRGASIKKSKNVTADYSLPTKASSESRVEKSDKSAEIDKELDFFHQRSHKETEEEDEEETEDSSIPPPIIQNAKDAQKLRESYHGKVTGEDVPLPIGSFEDLIGRFDLDKKLLANLVSGGFKEPTPIQCEAIPGALYDRDIIGCAPTGSGKTLAFLIPMVQRLRSKKGLQGVIVSPTKELAYQINTQLEALVKDLDVKTAFLNKSLASKIRDKVVRADRYTILVSTPLRLIDLVQNEALDLSSVQQLVLDEADKMFDQGFAEQTDRILSACSNPKLRRSIFSATITSSVEAIAQSIMTFPERIIIGKKEAANDSIEQELVYCGDEHGKLVAIRQMVSAGQFKPPVIIFLQSIPRAKALFNELLYDGLNVDVIHAERTQTQRQKVIDQFKKGELWCLICTDVLARGIDFKGINLVINYDVPNSAQAYVHRIGRTGRAGRAGKAITLYTKVDMDSIKVVVNVMKNSGCADQVPKWLRDGTAKLGGNQKRMLKNNQIKRQRISTVSKVDRNKRRKNREMVEGSKRRQKKEAEEK